MFQSIEEQRESFTKLAKMPEQQFFPISFGKIEPNSYKHLAIPLYNKLVSLNIVSYGKPFEDFMKLIEKICGWEIVNRKGKFLKRFKAGYNKELKDYWEEWKRDKDIQSSYFEAVKRVEMRAEGYTQKELDARLKEIIYRNFYYDGKYVSPRGSYYFKHLDDIPAPTTPDEIPNQCPLKIDFDDKLLGNLGSFLANSDISQTPFIFVDMHRNPEEFDPGAFGNSGSCFREGHEFGYVPRILSYNNIWGLRLFNIDDFFNAYEDGWQDEDDLLIPTYNETSSDGRVWVIPCVEEGIGELYILFNAYELTLEQYATILSDYYGLEIAYTNLSADRLIYINSDRAVVLYKSETGDDLLELFAKLKETHHILWDIRLRGLSLRKEYNIIITPDCPSGLFYSETLDCYVDEDNNDFYIWSDHIQDYLHPEDACWVESLGSYVNYSEVEYCEGCQEYYDRLEDGYLCESCYYEEYPEEDVDADQDKD